MTVYQILERLPPLVRSDLLARYGVPGKHAKKRYTAATALAQVLGGMGDVSVDYLDTKDLGLTVAKTEIQAGYQVCALYRLTSRSP